MSPADAARDVEVQREITRVALAGIENSGFALAGSGAIRERGVIERPTEDIDLFDTSQDVDAFGRAVERVVVDCGGVVMRWMRSAGRRSSRRC